MGKNVKTQIKRVHSAHNTPSPLIFRHKPRGTYKANPVVRMELTLRQIEALLFRLDEAPMTVSEPTRESLTGAVNVLDNHFRHAHSEILRAADLGPS